MANDIRPERLAYTPWLLFSSLAPRPRGWLSVLFMLCLGLALAGCGALKQQHLAAAGQYAVNAAVLANQVELIRPEIRSAETVIDSHIDRFSAAEQTQLRGAKQSIDSAFATVAGITAGQGGAPQVLVSLSTIQGVYAQAKSGYRSARAVLEAHPDLFTAQQQADLQSLDAQATSMDDTMAKLQGTGGDNAQAAAALRQALQVLAAGARIAIAAGI